MLMFVFIVSHYESIIRHLSVSSGHLYPIGSLLPDYLISDPGWDESIKTTAPNPL